MRFARRNQTAGHPSSASEWQHLGGTPDGSRVPTPRRCRRRLRAPGIARGHLGVLGQEAGARHQRVQDRGHRARPDQAVVGVEPGRERRTRHGQRIRPLGAGRRPEARRPRLPCPAGGGLRRLPAEHGGLGMPDPPSGGSHFYFKCPAGLEIVSKASALGDRYPGIDTRAERAHVVVSPSFHPTSGTHVWEVDSSPAEIPVQDLPAAPPAWVTSVVEATGWGGLIVADRHAGKWVRSPV